MVLWEYTIISHSSIEKELNPFGVTQMMMSSIDLKDVS